MDALFFKIFQTKVQSIIHVYRQMDRQTWWFQYTFYLQNFIFWEYYDKKRITLSSLGALRVFDRIDRRGANPWWLLSDSSVNSKSRLRSSLFFSMLLDKALKTLANLTFSSNVFLEFTVSTSNIICSRRVYQLFLKGIVYHQLNYK